MVGVNPTEEQRSELFAEIEANEANSVADTADAIVAEEMDGIDQTLEVEDADDLASVEADEMDLAEQSDEESPRTVALRGFTANPDVNGQYAEAMQRINDRRVWWSDGGAERAAYVIYWCPKDSRWRISSTSDLDAISEVQCPSVANAADGAEQMFDTQWIEAEAEGATAELVDAACEPSGSLLESNSTAVAAR